jgi:hypothetical protein
MIETIDLKHRRTGTCRDCHAQGITKSTRDVFPVTFKDGDIPVWLCTYCIEEYRDDD